MLLHIVILALVLSISVLVTALVFGRLRIVWMAIAGTGVGWLTSAFVVIPFTGYPFASTLKHPIPSFYLFGVYYHSSSWPILVGCLAGCLLGAAIETYRGRRAARPETANSSFVRGSFVRGRTRSQSPHSPVKRKAIIASAVSGLCWGILGSWLTRDMFAKTWLAAPGGIAVGVMVFYLCRWTYRKPLPILIPTAVLSTFVAVGLFGVCLGIADLTREIPQLPHRTGWGVVAFASYACMLGLWLIPIFWPLFVVAFGNHLLIRYLDRDRLVAYGSCTRLGLKRHDQGTLETREPIE